jgi:hypothetical protein
MDSAFAWKPGYLPDRIQALVRCRGMILRMFSGLLGHDNVQAVDRGGFTVTEIAGRLSLRTR